MIEIGSVDLGTSGVPRRVELLIGDLASLPAETAVDVLVVSAFPGNYEPTADSLIGALDRVGVSVLALAQHKELDLRSTSSCWLSRPIETPSVYFRHILCFEPTPDEFRGVDELVGDVFRSVVPVTAGEPWVRSVAMPLLATGDQGHSKPQMLAATLDAAWKWIESGLDLEVLRIVVRDDVPTPERRALAQVFDEFVQRSRPRHRQGGEKHDFDLFISYSHEDADAINRVRRRLDELAPDLRVFLDRERLVPGNAWQQRIFESIDSAQQVLAFYTPSYLNSKICIEEIHIALIRHRDHGGVLIPAYLRTAALPSYMRLVQYLDVRESDGARLDDLAAYVARRCRPDGQLSEPLHEVAPGAAETLAPAVTGDLPAMLRSLADGQELQLDVTVRLRPPNR